MSTVTLHATPDNATVIQEQVRATIVGLRTEALLILSGMFLLSLIALAALLRNAPNGHIGTGPTYITAAPVSLIALLLPFAVWRAESPSQRSYHWAMPVARSAHTYMRLFAGWSWMMAMVAVYMGFALAFIVGVPVFYGGSVGIFWAQWALFVPFVAATVAYLLTSIAVIASDHPWRWVGGIFVAYFILAIFAEALHLDLLRTITSEIVKGRYGVGPGVFGDINRVRTGLDVQGWLSASGLWGAIGAVGVWAATTFRKEA